MIEIPDLGQWMWGRGVRQHQRLVAIVRYMGTLEKRSRRLVVARVLMEGDRLFEVRLLTRQTERQVKQAIEPATYECAVQGFLSAETMKTDQGVVFRPFLGRVGLRRAEIRELQRRAPDQQAAAGP